MLKRYSSNTIAGSGNQYFFLPEKESVQTGRIFYKISHAGEYNYSLMFSNTIDSTYSDGEISHKNLICDSWNIIQARVAQCDKNAIIQNFTDPEIANAINNKEYEFTTITFNGNVGKEVSPGEFFCSDSIKLSFDKDDYLCLEISFSGVMIPYHEETLLPVFVKDDNGWAYNNKMPFASMIGCDRTVKAKIGFLGDSITQGMGTPLNSYMHWNAILSHKLGDKYACWNLGLGYGRANDMASDGAWAYKAKQNDILFVCYGVNDIIQGSSEKQIMEDLTAIVLFLKKENKKVILLTIPPFDYTSDNILKWENVNNYIRNELSEKVDLVFDVVPILQKNNREPYLAKYGGHPNVDGCKVLAEEIYKELIKTKML